MKKLVVILICFAVLLPCILSAHASNSIVSPPPSDIEAVINSAVVESVRDGTYIRTLSAAAIASIQAVSSTDLLSMSNNTFFERNTKILHALGFDDLEIASLDSDFINKIIADGEILQTSTTYYRIDEATGSPIAIPMDEFLLATSQSSYFEGSNTVSPRSNSNSGTAYFTDSYFKTTILATYRPGFIRGDTGLDDGIAENGWYTFIGQFTFYGDMPSTRKTDAASLLIAPSTIAWGDYSSDFSSTIAYTTSQGQSITDSKSTTDRHVEPEGFYYTWDLPDDDWIRDIDITGITISIQGNGRISQYTQDCAFNVWSRYEHIDTEVDIDFVWEESEEGIAAIIPDGVDINREDVIDTYQSYIYVSYIP